MSTKFDRKIKKKFFVPLIAKNWNNNNYYSDDNNQKKKKNFTLRTNRNRNLFPSSSYFPKYTKEHSNKITGQYQQNSKTENPSILADASFEDGKVEISLSLSLFPSSRFTFPPFRPFLSLSLPPSLLLSPSLYPSIPLSPSLSVGLSGVPASFVIRSGLDRQRAAQAPWSSSPNGPIPGGFLKESKRRSLSPSLPPLSFDQEQGESEIGQREVRERERGVEKKEQGPDLQRHRPRDRLL